MILENLHDASKQLEGKNYPAACDVILLIDKIHSDLNPEEIKYHGKLKSFIQNQRRNLKKPNRFQENRFKNTWLQNCVTFVHPSYPQHQAERDKVKKKIFADLKDKACFEDAIYDMEEDVNEIVPETQHESQTQSLGHPARRNLSRTQEEEALRPVIREFKTRLQDEIDM